MISPIPLSIGTANTIVRNVGCNASDEALLEEARSQDNFQESDTELLEKLHAAQRRLKGAARGGYCAAIRKAERKAGEVAHKQRIILEIRSFVANKAPFTGDEEWARIVEGRISRCKTSLDLLDLMRDLSRTHASHVDGALRFQDAPGFVQRIVA